VDFSFTSQPETPDDAAQADLVVRGTGIESFVARYVSKFAEFEIWVMERLHSLPNPRNDDKLIGQRLKALRSALAEQSTIVQNPQKVSALLEQLQPYIDLRAVLAHGHSTSASGKGGATFHVFEIACPCAHHRWKARTLIRADELKALQSGLSDLVNQLKQQTPNGRA
jgi:hypothetical protein